MVAPGTPPKRAARTQPKPQPTMIPTSLPRTVRYLIALLVAGLALAGGLAGLALATADTAPIAEMAALRTALSRAAQAGAGQHAPEPFRRATGAADSAMAAWRIENGRLYYRRNYDRVREIAIRGRRFAETAERDAASRRASLHETAAAREAVLNRAIAHFRTRYATLPLDPSVFESVGRAELLALEGRTARNGGEAARALDTFAAAQRQVDQATRQAEQTVAAYLAMLPTWREWVIEIVDWSRRERRPAIVIDKLARACSLYVNGEPVAVYEAEFGPNWMGDKRHVGDRATPEGHYRVTRKKANGETRYHRALLLDYPNDEDRRRFVDSVRTGSLPDSLTIGNLIEIHGEGGREMNWTDGCVALANGDMERLFDRAEVGTPVIIVGSLTGFPPPAR